MKHTTSYIRLAALVAISAFATSALAAEPEKMDWSVTNHGISHAEAQAEVHADEIDHAARAINGYYFAGSETQKPNRAITSARVSVSGIGRTGDDAPGTVFKNFRDDLIAQFIKMLGVVYQANTSKLKAPACTPQRDHTTGKLLATERTGEVEWLAVDFGKVRNDDNTGMVDGAESSDDNYVQPQRAYFKATADGFVVDKIEQIDGSFVEFPEEGKLSAEEFMGALLPVFGETQADTTSLMGYYYQNYALVTADRHPRQPSQGEFNYDFVIGPVPGFIRITTEPFKGILTAAWDVIYTHAAQCSLTEQDSVIDEPFVPLGQRVSLSRVEGLQGQVTTLTREKGEEKSAKETAEELLKSARAAADIDESGDLVATITSLATTAAAAGTAETQRQQAQGKLDAVRAELGLEEGADLVEAIKALKDAQSDKGGEEPDEQASTTAGGGDGDQS